ncbi:hypothetical protein CCYA_CCYA17G4318 [Cyanidiococcus yangmingshanensis]|nr:hypothetical protein CCYA_CCYA17G4318 [Cyanidiococcus yangmingshanensis]
MDFLTVLEPSAVWKVTLDRDQGRRLLTHVSEPEVPLEVGAALAPATTEVYEFLSEKIFSPCGNAELPPLKTCVLLFGGTRRYLWAEKTILDQMFSKLGGFGARVVDFVAVAVHGLANDSPVYIDLVLESWQTCVGGLGSPPAEQSVALVLDKVLECARSREHADVDCTIYELIVEGVNKHLSSVFTLICIPSAKPNILKKVLLWFELSQKKPQKFPEPWNRLRKVVSTASYLCSILYVDDALAGSLLPFVDAVARRVRGLVRKSEAEL